MSKTKKANKIIAIVGTTASGKTTLAVKLAKKYHGEIISVDSRQVYKYMDIGTGKDLDEYTIIQNGKIKKIPYHLIDVVHPNTDFNLGKFYKKASKAINEILNKGKLPIIAGGTGLYVQSIIDGYNLSSVKPDPKLRAELEKQSIVNLFNKLKKIDKKFTENLNHSDRNNKRRLIRYIEIKSNKKNNIQSSRAPEYNSIIIGLTWPQEILKQRIYKRLIQRKERQNLIEEVEILHNKHRVSWKRLINFGLEYKYITLYLQNKISYDEMIEELNRAIYQFSRRQMTWLRRWERSGAKIHWTRDIKAIDKLIKK